MKKCGTKRCGSNVDGSCTIGGGPACSFFSEYDEQPTSAPVDSQAAGSIPVNHDGLDRLANAVYGRNAKPREWIGGSDAQILYDAAQMIERLSQSITE